MGNIFMVTVGENVPQCITRTILATQLGTVEDSLLPAKHRREERAYLTRTNLTLVKALQQRITSSEISWLLKDVIPMTPDTLASKQCREAHPLWHLRLFDSVVCL